MKYRKTEKRREARRLGCSVRELERSGGVLYVKGTSTRAEDVSSVAEARERVRAAKERRVETPFSSFSLELW